MSRASSIFLLVFLLACGDDDGPPADGGTDAADANDANDANDGGEGIDLRIDGLSAAVNAHFDADGILNLDCQTNDDCTAALGYFHARDRFVQMDFRRRLTTGRISQILSAFAASQALSVDVANRALFSARDGTPAEEVVLGAMSDETRALYDAYARGVNAWIDDVQEGRNGAVFPREFMNGLLFNYDPARIPRWEPQDSVSTVLALINSLTNASRFEIANGERRAEFVERFGAETGEAMFRDLFDTRTDIDVPIDPNFGAMASRMPTRGGVCAESANPRLAFHSPAPERALTELFEENGLRHIFDPSTFSEPGRHGGFGSNNWVVAPSRSASGNALFANDPHLGMTNPATWYVAHLDAKTNGSGDLHVAGMTFAGLPSVVIGQNEQISWGATTTNLDFTDVYVEELSADGNSVTFRGEQVEIIRRPFDVQLADGTSTATELRFVPHHGPILSMEDDTVLSLRWTGSDVSTDINFLTDLAGAGTVEEARIALRQITTVGQNWVVADVDGNIGWFPYNRIPERPWATSFSPDGQPEAVPWLPLDGRGDFEWESFYEPEELPQLLNPPRGYIATANGDMTGALADGDPTNDPFGVFQTNVAPGYRQQRIVDLLEASDAHDVASMEALIADTFSLISQRITPDILSAAEGLPLSASATKIVDALRAWSFACPTGLQSSDAAEGALSADAAELGESAGCAAFHVAIREINRGALADEGVLGERGPNVALVRLLRGETLGAGDIYWDDVSTEDVVETQDDIIAAALDRAGTFLEGELGDDASQWAWGRIHFLTLRSDVDSASGGLVTDFNESGFANNGGLFTVDVANPNDDYGQTAGASVRFICELATQPECTIQIPGGQSAHVDDPSYLGLLERYIDNQSRPLPMDISTAADGAATSFELRAP